MNLTLTEHQIGRRVEFKTYKVCDMLVKVPSYMVIVGRNSSSPGLTYTYCRKKISQH